MFLPEATSQNRDSSKTGINGVYAELYLMSHDFSDGFVSINYERVFGKKKRAELRIGIYQAFDLSVINGKF